VAPAHFQSLTRSGAFDALASPALLAALDGLLGRTGWQAPERWGRALVTFPQGLPWQLPARGWHQDSSDRPGDPALVAFLCLAPVRPEGGGTLVVTGSHRLTGDAFLMPPRLMHAVAPNALDTPRLMLLQFVQQRADATQSRAAERDPAALVTYGLSQKAAVGSCSTTSEAAAPPPVRRGPSRGPAAAARRGLARRRS